MGRHRVYTSDAERQRAYRAHLKAAADNAATASRPPGRPPSRPSRLMVLRKGAEDLQQEYAHWLDTLPESLQDGARAARLSETIESLEEVVATLSQLEPPRGFGRD